MKMPRVLVAAFALLTVNALHAQSATPTDLASALFIDKAAPELQKDAMLCLSVDETDVNPALLKSLRNKDERFVVASDCVRVSDTSKGSFHEATKKPAYFISIFNFRPLENGDAHISFSIFHHGTWASHQTLLVQKTDGQWKVVKKVFEIAS